ncbi:NAD(P)H-dependent glycerol-3-phosphate dehydrogenase [Succinivibrio faecicola]|uniref:Glycerol-3-phosphate dehydrogenase [NAD(P)+] n=1 Tax=Succinivibrio faecicola TaxID=2820300 RepID=A0ABS7DJT4_9GAMM|nr:NAD(P)H-dependent glycerol-3-phosphate dehydrogenase [Succinivibrio faecicola]MBW7570811.1 NAD(P)H-dependent glycerol-3-phosphate dehydrogenase [Succinivibrio faecicola]
MAEFMYDLTVIGAGSYGTALAISTASKGLKVMLWTRREETAKIMQHDRVNQKYLPSIAFPETLTVSSDLNHCINASKTVLVVVPSHTFADVLVSIKPYLTPEHRLAWATKGLDKDSGRLLSDIASQILSDKIPMAALSGPTFAMELAKGLPTAIAVAGTDSDFIKEFCELMHTKTFRIYESDDLVGLQLGGGIKNVIAIGAGLSDGLGYGANARTALITRGLAEMTRLGEALGSSQKAFMGLSGLGDLILTCTDNQSRNRRFGYYLGQGMSVEKALEKIEQVVEGYTMSKVVVDLCEKFNVQMPICQEVYKVIYEGKNGQAAAMSLLGRSLKSE